MVRRIVRYVLEGDEVPPTAATPTLFQRVAYGALSPNQGLTATNFTMRLPNPTGAGNCLVLFVDYTSGKSVSTITDDGSNSWSATAVASADAGAGQMKTEVFVCPNVAGGTRAVTLTFSAAEGNVHFLLVEYYNTATSSATGVTASSASGTAPTISTSAISPASGNLVLHYAFQNPNTIGNSGTTTVTSWTAASGWELEAADYASGNSSTTYNQSAHALQVRQAPGGSITPTLTTSGTNTYNTLAFELKGAAAGTAPPAGIRILRQTWFTNNNINIGPWVQPLPTSGNLIVVMDTVGLMYSAPTDSGGNSWTYSEGGAVGLVSLAWAPNTAPSRAMTISLPTEGRTTIPNTTFMIHDITGANPSSPYVQSTIADGQSGTGNFVDQPIITPQETNGLIIALCAIGQGPLTSLTQPSGGLFFGVTYPGETDLDSFQNSDGYACIYYGSTLTQQSWGWGYSGTNQTVFSAAGEFRVAGAFVPDEDFWEVRGPPDRVEVVSTW
jgi:hypothetical protein